MSLFVESEKFLLGNGAVAEIRPLTYRQREHARNVARDAALELAGSIDPALLGSARDNPQATAAVAEVKLTGDLDTVTVVESGLVSIKDETGEVHSVQDSDVLDRITAQVFETIAAEIYRISTVASAENLGTA